MKIIIRILAVIALSISIVWLYFERDFEPAFTTIVSLSTLISTFLFEKEDTKQRGQYQEVGDNSTVIQAGGDVNIKDSQC